MMFNDSNQMNSRKQVSNEYDDTTTGDEQIRPVVFYSSPAKFIRLSFDSQ